MIRQSEIRTTISDFLAYRSATYLFKDKYYAWPGDMPNATKIWGALDSGDGLGTDCINIESTNLLTCNGDGDGIIDGLNRSEVHRYWQHLANAGMIPGKYTGRGADLTPTQENSYPGLNAPVLRLSGATFSLRYIPYYLVYGAQTVYFTAQKYEHSYYLGVNQFGAILTPEESFLFDTKVDDGIPGTGSVTTYPNIASPPSWMPSTCATTAVPATAVYDLANTSRICALILDLGF